MDAWKCPTGAWNVVRRDRCERCPEGILGYQGYRMALGRPRTRVEVPDGLVVLLLGLGDPIRVWPFEGDTTPPPGGALRVASSMLAGPATRAFIGRHEGRVHGVEVALAPWAAYRLFGGVVAELVDDSVPFADLRLRWLDDLVARLGVTSGWTARFALLDDVLGARIGDGPECAPEVARTWHLVRASRGLLRVDELARSVGWSTRYLQRRFKEQTGLTPKESARLVRLSHAATLLRAGRPGAEVAGLCGFYDQAHLWREFRSAMGGPPGLFFPGGTAPAGPAVGPPTIRADRFTTGVTWRT